MFSSKFISEDKSRLRNDCEKTHVNQNVCARRGSPRHGREISMRLDFAKG